MTPLLSICLLVFISTDTTMTTLSSVIEGQDNYHPIVLLLKILAISLFTSATRLLLQKYLQRSFCSYIYKFFHCTLAKRNKKTNQTKTKIHEILPWSAWVSVTWDLAIACEDANISCLDYCNSCLFGFISLLDGNKVISIPAWLCVGSFLTLQPHLALYFPLFPLISHSVFSVFQHFSALEILYLCVT